MNMNGIINMILRVIMRKAINSGINSGMKAVNGKKRKKPQRVAEDDLGYIEPYSEPRTDSYAASQAQPSQSANDGKPTQAQVRERRRARRERQANRQAK
ncbi:MAG: hypothetical protein ACI92Z_003583 [Paracoccaceae bacterium]|jgi:hypothetical protein